MKFALPKPSEFRLRIDRERTTSVVQVPGSQVGEEIEVEPDMLPIPPLSEGGDRTWGWIHLLGYWGELMIETPKDARINGQSPKRSESRNTKWHLPPWLLVFPPARPLVLWPWGISSWLVRMRQTVTSVAYTVSTSPCSRAPLSANVEFSSP